MAVTEIRGKSQIKDATLNRAKLTADFLEATDLDLTAGAKDATLKGLKDAVLADSPATKGQLDTDISALDVRLDTIEAVVEVIGEAPVVTVGVAVLGALANTPSAGSLMVYFNGTRAQEGAGNDYTLAAAVITWHENLVTGDLVLCDYKY